MQQDKIDYKLDGINSVKFEKIDTTEITDKSVMLNVKLLNEQQSI
jgi:hypothetical protein